MTDKKIPVLHIGAGYFPSISEIKGLPFDVKVVLHATDIDFAEHVARVSAMERIVKTWNVHDDLVSALENIMSATWRPEGMAEHIADAARAALKKAAEA